jgi:hypothetical protein
MSDRWRSFSFLLITLTALICGIAKTASAQTDAEVDAARLKALDFIRSAQQTDGSWVYPGHETGITALCTMTLIENGAAVYDSVVDKGYRYVRKNAPDQKQTYDIALGILLLARVGDRQDRPVIRTLGARLLAGQTTSGGWSYSCPNVESSVLQDLKRLDRKDGPGDNSNTQFAVLGLWIASRYGVPIDDAMKDVSFRFVNTQNADGGWGYTMKDKEPTPSGEAMTPAGLFCLTVARATKIRAQLKDRSANASGSERETLLNDPKYAKGLSRVGAYAKGIGPGSARYFVWAIERIGVLLGQEKFEGDVDWFKLGADALIKSQKSNGSWPADKPESALADTCFASLFLRKANLGSDISRLLQGQPEKAFSITNRPDVPREDTLQDILKAAKPGDVIRVDGNGPFKTNHDEFTHDLTIQAGFGYEPVFEYQLGMSPDGLRYRVEKNSESHHMLKISAGTVTLEGLRIQMDAPAGASNIPWKAVQVTGGTLRMLNCAISESNRKGMVAVTLSGEAQAVLRNCILVGGRTSVEIVASGKQEVTFDNCVVFSNPCITVVNNPQTKQPANVDLHIYQSVLQGTEAIACPKLVGDVRIDSILSAYKCDSLGLSFLASATDKKTRTWSGNGNCYNLTNWIGADGKKIAAVTDPKSFAKFWGNADTDGTKLSLIFASTRRNGSFSHGVNPQDWDLSEKSELALFVKRPGIRPATVGSGEGFSRYREDFNYGQWKKGINTAAVLADAAK